MRALTTKHNYRFTFDQGQIEGHEPCVGVSKNNFKKHMEMLLPEQKTYYINKKVSKVFSAIENE